MTTPFKPVSVNNELLTQDKVQQIANNTQWLFDNTPRLRYAVSGLTRDTGLKLLAGKAAHGIINTQNWLHGQIQFGSFFSANCKPIVTIGLEGQNGILHRNSIIIYPLAGTEIDNTGFGYVVQNTIYGGISATGWIHYQAIGY